MERENEFRNFLFDCMGPRRFTQDSPVLPDVWIAYDGSGEDPFEMQQDLLLTPHFGCLAGRVAKDLRAAVEAARKSNGREPPRIAQLPGIVAASLYLDELLHILLPRTKWWQQQVEGKKLFWLDDDFATLLRAVDEGRDAGSPVKGDRETVPVGILWLLHVVAFLIAKFPPDWKERSGKMRPSREDYREACRRIFLDKASFTALADEKREPSLGVVATNRPATPAGMESVLAVKADAARLLFNVSCSEITWAVIDSGIDAGHPAFAVRDAATGAAKAGESRVIGAYDLTLVRELLDPRFISSLFEKDARLDERSQAIRKRFEINIEERNITEKNAAPKLAVQLRERLEAGFELDWGLVEPFLWIRKDDREPPARGHGTMVAGLIGADWREPPRKQEEANENPGLDAAAQYKVKMQGICPDIRFYDMRVIGPEGDSNEFELLAALQLIRFLNEQSDRREIHGANISLSTQHDVASYACGSTLVCQECDRTWASGVVLVAAAGNKGHQRYMLAGGGALDGYHGMSITDPGNAEGIITVGATHRANPHQYGVSYFSSRGPTGDGRQKPDLVAPGEKVEGPVPHGGSTIDDGTSFAAPHVSGAAAMLMARNAELVGRPQRIKEILCRTATDLGRERYFQGAGMLDILRALQSV